MRLPQHDGAAGQLEDADGAEASKNWVRGCLLQSHICCSTDLRNFSICATSALCSPTFAASRVAGVSGSMLVLRFDLSPQLAFFLFTTPLGMLRRVSNTDSEHTTGSLVSVRLS